MRARTGFAIALLLVFAVLCLGATLWIRRGFRLRSTPTASEAYVASKIRNFAIPASERHSKTALDATPENLQQARELFIEHCASCHGLDGSARTQLGENLYPHVPDLRASQTQTLTDGELPYIIENGVQLNRHPCVDRSSRRLAGPVHPQPDEAESSAKEPAGGRRFTSSPRWLASLRQVPRGIIYERWKKTPMANVVRDPRAHADAIVPDLKTNHVEPFIKEQVALVYGSLWKQRYFTKVGDDCFPLGAQWEVKNKKWSNYHVADGADWRVPFWPACRATILCKA